MDPFNVIIDWVAEKTSEITGNIYLPSFNSFILSPREKLLPAVNLFHFEYLVYLILIACWGVLAFFFFKKIYPHTNYLDRINSKLSAILKIGVGVNQYSFRLFSYLFIVLLASGGALAISYFFQPAAIPETKILGEESIDKSQFPNPPAAQPGAGYGASNSLVYTEHDPIFNKSPFSSVIFTKVVSNDGIIEKYKTGDLMIKSNGLIRIQTGAVGSREIKDGSIGGGDIDKNADLEVGTVYSRGVMEAAGDLIIGGNTIVTNGQINVGDKVITQGDIGIGISNPLAKLHVHQTAPDPNEILFLISTGDDSQRFAFDEDGDMEMDGNLVIGGTITSGTWNGTVITDGYIANDITLTSITQITNRDHGSLQGLSDDDHLQYHTDGRADTWLGTKSLADLGTRTHSLLTGLLDDDHTQYALLAGRAGGQTLIGGTAVTDILKLQGTSGNGTLTSPAIQMLVGNAGATTALTVLNNGNVGIGTTTPGTNLEVYGANAAIKVNTGTYSVQLSYNQLLSNNSTLYINNGVANNVVMGGGGGSIYFPGSGIWNSSGNVGIGTTGPADKLEIETTGSTQANLLLDSPSGVNNWVKYAEGGTVQWYLGRTDFWAGDDFALLDGDGSTYRLVVKKSSGNVGIGTTSPNVGLHLGATAASVLSSANDLFITGDIEVAGGTIYGASSKPHLQLDDSVGSVLYYDTGTHLDVASNLIKFYTSSGEKVRIDSSGNVGIGTTAPGTKLDVTGTQRISGYSGQGLIITQDTNVPYQLLLQNTNAGTKQMFFFLDSAGALRFDSDTTGGIMKLTNTGNVGIGTTSPSSLLHLYAASPVIQAFSSTSAGDPALWLARGSDTTLGSKLWFDNDAGSTYIDNYWNNNAGNIYFRTKVAASSVNAVTILGAGNVGIGTTSPAQKLDVNGAIRVENTSTYYGEISHAASNGGISNLGGLQFLTKTLASGDSGGNIVFGRQVDANSYAQMVIQYTGNVGIGTTGPGAKLEIASAGNSTTPFRIYAGDGSELAKFYETSGGASQLFLLDAAGTNTGVLLSGGTNANSYVGATGGNFAVGANEPGTAKLYVNGNVGIGTTSPGERLDIGATGKISLGAVKLQRDNGISSYISNDAASYIYDTNGGGASYPFNAGGHLVIQSRSDAARDIIFATGATTPSERLVIKNTGNVGIGTTGPTGKLHIADTTTADPTSPHFYISHQDYNAQIRLDTNPSSGRYWDIEAQKYDATQGYRLAFNYLGSGKMVLSSSGNVGIGTANPSVNLQVNATGNAILRLDGTTGAQYQFLTNGSQVGIIYGGSTFNIDSATGTLYLQRLNNYGITLWNEITSGNPFLTLYGYDSGAATKKYGRLSISAAGKFLLEAENGEDFGIYTGGSERVTVLNTGNVGIGTTAPGAKLHVYNGASGATPYQTTGLTVEEASFAVANFLTINGGETRLWFGSPVSNTAGRIRYVTNATVADGYMSFRAGDVETMTIKNGNVGIGTTGPLSKLSVAGNLSVGNTAAGTDGTRVLILENGTIPSTSPIDSIQLYAEDVTASSELKVRDEAGFITTLSPHNFSIIPEGPSEDLAWSFYSQRKNLAINVDMARTIRLVEQLTGQQLIYLKDLKKGRYFDGQIESEPLLALEMIGSQNEILNQVRDDIGGITLKTDESITTLSELKISTDENLAIISQNINDLAVADQDLQDQMDELSGALDNQKSLTDKLEEQMEQMDAANDSLLVLKAQLELLDSRVGLLETLMKFNAESKNLEISADAVFSGTLEVKNLLKLGKFEEAPECDEDSEGSIHYNKTEKHFYGCNGNDWVRLDEQLIEEDEVNNVDETDQSSD